MAKLIKFWEDGRPLLRCNECGHVFQFDENWRCFLFCYNCGAKMDGE